MNELLCIFKDKNKWKIFLDNECVMNYCTFAWRKLKNLQWYINSLNVYNFQIKYCVWYLQYIYCVVLLVHIKHIPRIYLLGVGSWQNWWWETTTAGNKLAWEGMLTSRNITSLGQREGKYVKYNFFFQPCWSLKLCWKVWKGCI